MEHILLNQQSLQIYPNPSSGMFYLANHHEIKQLTLTSPNGLSFNIEPKTILQIDVPEGIYHLKAQLQDGTYSSSKVSIR